MNLRQLNLLNEIARNSFNISAAAESSHTSQSGASRQIALLEHELGVKLLVRRKNKILGFTDIGRKILAVATRLLNEAENIRLISADARGENGGRLVVATSHLHARYTLRNPAKEFSQKHADVELHLLQADPENIFNLVEKGAAHIGMSTELHSKHDNLLLLPGAPIKRIAIMPKGHALSQKKRLSLMDLVRYPIVGYHAGSTAGRLLTDAFKAKGLEPRMVVSANDSDVIKTYVAEGLGIAIVPSPCIDETERAVISTTDVTGLFPKTFMTISLRRDRHLRNYLTDFISLVAPKWTRKAIQQEIASVTCPPVH